ncbi:MAG: acyl-CoA thioesterase [Actinobacteria bacterium]|nr:acyl-CoA thioesterase [Actinomycetota bacterium]MBM3697435.1 acyl-CoA thioesterase [Actinomycetota bacterium]
MEGRAGLSASDHDHPPFAFSTRFRVDLADTDAGGVVYFGRYGRYLERAVFEYRRAAGVPVLGEPGHQFMVRSMTVEYHAPLRFEDEIEAFVRVSAVGTTSHAMDVRFERIDAHGAVHVADARAVVVGVESWDGGGATPMPAAWREAIEAFEARTH